LDVVKVAGNPDARDRGPMIVVNNEIHSARDVTKVASGRPDAWSSGNLGVLGLIDKRGNMAFLRRTEHRHAPDTEFDINGVDPTDFPCVEIVYCTVEMNSAMIEAAVENGANGIVLAGHPSGAAAMTGQATTARGVHNEGIPVVMSHRGREGWPYPNERYIWSNTLTPQKARILLMLALLETSDYDEIARIFEEY